MNEETKKKFEYGYLELSINEMQKGVDSLAKLMRSYYISLIAENFTDAQAMCLVIEFQNSLLPKSQR